MTSMMKDLIKIAINEVNSNGGIVRVVEEKTGETVRVALKDNKIFLTVEQ